MKTFQDFYPYYLAEHQHPVTQWFHGAGAVGLLGLWITGLILGEWWYLMYGPLCSYGCAWFSHFFVERNRPTTFRYPWWSVRADFLMVRALFLKQLR